MLTEKPEIEFVKIGDEYVYAVTFTLPETDEHQDYLIWLVRSLSTEALLS